MEDTKTTMMVHDNLKMERSPLDWKLLAHDRNGISNEPLEHVLHSTKEEYREVLVNTNHYVLVDIICRLNLGSMQHMSQTTSRPDIQHIASNFNTQQVPSQQVMRIR